MDTTAVLDKYTQDLSNLPLEIKHLLQELKNKDSQLQDARKRYQTKDNQIHKFIRANGTLTKHPKEQQIYNKIEEDMILVEKLQKEKILLSNTALFLVSKHLFNFETDIAKLERDELLPTISSVFELDGPGTGSTAINSSISGLNDSLSNTPTSRTNTGISATPVAESNNRRQTQKRKHTSHRASPSLGGGTNSSRANKRAKSEEYEQKRIDDGNLGNVSANGATSGLNGLTSSNKDDYELMKIKNDNNNKNNDGLSNSASKAAAEVGNTAPANGEDADNRLYCFCQQVSFREMIGCDNDDCKYEWFHWGCVGITAPPKDDEIWYCPDCAPKMEKRKKKRK